MSQPQTFTGYMPKEIIIEILSWASVKTLLRLKCVCKLWKLLISDASFIRKHLGRMANNPSRHHLLLNDNHGTRTQLLSISMHSLLCFKDTSTLNPTRHVLSTNKTRLKFFKPVGSCNGLVLLFYPSTNVPSLWNPSTRDIKLLPDFDCEWNPKPPYPGCGLGFDPLSNDYKVIEIFYYPSKQVWLYSLKSNSWRRIEDFRYEIETIGHHYHRVVGNRVFWVMPHEKILVSFDFVKETFHEFPLPQDKSSFRAGTFELEVLARNLYLIHHDGLYVGIWRMNESGGKESWCKQFTFIHPKKFKEKGGRFIPQLLCITVDEVMLGYGYGIVVYNKLKGVYRVALFEDLHCHTSWTYVESLVPL